jgi:hypothetical protein
MQRKRPSGMLHTLCGIALCRNLSYFWLVNHWRTSVKSESPGCSWLPLQSVQTVLQPLLVKFELFSHSFVVGSVGPFSDKTVHVLTCSIFNVLHLHCSTHRRHVSTARWCKSNDYIDLSILYDRSYRQYYLTQFKKFSYRPL